ncbi:O-antigen/teichoic acid export membrane protein [Arthrobacter sp. SLBN-83]|uniref:oligosaccharide flippase family protein n=1 Tax=Arthrobacter sp. SLBN-83 TaxID=2768449 RepID=UPI001154417B|nr:oligosaccharide flippase family protein [Arthrobacter sp. SLBN-83]TQJ59044.1 O-antigen/teichoic acid export membrane protein [Arthrobacter sp. SLBN-83]
MTTVQYNFGARVRSGMTWSVVNSLVLRLGNFAVGIVLARLLIPEQFGVFAVALTVQAVLMTLADLGMSADLIRSDNHKEKAPTVATLGAVSGIAATAALAASAQTIADALGSGPAGPVIAVLSLSLMLAGLGVVPFASLQREFEQKKLFIIAVIEFATSTTVTIGLVLAGWGAMGLAAGRIIAQVMTLILQFVMAGQSPKFGFSRSIAPTILQFGIPVAGANLLSWALLNIDNVAISSMAGPVTLGFYYLAFNISNWPMSALGQVVRSISLPAFSRMDSNSAGKSLTPVVGPVWALSLLGGVLLAALSSPIIELVYGRQWLPAAPVLSWLGIFGALRALFDLAASFLLAQGAAKATLVVQVAWIAALAPVMFFAVHTAGSVGAAAAHLAICLFIVVPAYAIAIKGNSADLKAVASQLWPPLAAAAVAAGTILAVTAVVVSPLAALVLGTVVGAGVYALLLRTWFAARLQYIAGAFAGTAQPTQTHTDVHPQSGGER